MIPFDDETCHLKSIEQGGRTQGQKRVMASSLQKIEGDDSVLLRVTHSNIKTFSADIRFSQQVCVHFPIKFFSIFRDLKASLTCFVDVSRICKREALEKMRYFGEVDAPRTL